MALEQVSEERWKCVMADIGGERLRVLRSGYFVSGSDRAYDATALRGLQLSGAAEVTLVHASDKAVCRLYAMPLATAEQTRRMISMRLETDLPYPVPDSTWVCEREEARGTTAGESVLVIAAPTSEIVEAQAALIGADVRSNRVMLDAGALAELASFGYQAEETLAIVSVGELKTTLVISNRGKLRYARYIKTRSLQTDAENDVAQGVRELADELDQSIHHYALLEGSHSPSRLLVLGEGSSSSSVVQGLGDRMGIPVEWASCPGSVEMVASDSSVDDLVATFPSCLGALIAMHRRIRGESTAAPALNEQKSSLVGNLRVKRAALVGANLLFGIVLISALFGIRKGLIASGKRIAKDGQSIVMNLDRLQSEVDVLQFERGRQQHFLDALLLLTELIPKGITIETLTIDKKGNLAISGIAPSVESASQETISAMKASTAFANPKFLGATKHDKKFKFRMSCELSGSMKGGRR